MCKRCFHLDAHETSPTSLDDVVARQPDPAYVRAKAAKDRLSLAECRRYATLLRFTIEIGKDADLQAVETTGSRQCSVERWTVPRLRTFRVESRKGLQHQRGVTDCARQRTAVVEPVTQRD